MWHAEGTFGSLQTQAGQGMYAVLSMMMLLLCIAMKIWQLDAASLTALHSVSWTVTLHLMIWPCALLMGSILPHSTR